MHFTHVEHLAGIVRDGLLSDTRTQAAGAVRFEAGDYGIKERRRHRMVTCGSGGVVADYVPLYYAPRSPMMYRIDRGGVETYASDCHSLVYLASSVERLLDLTLEPVFTDRNAVLDLADQTTEIDRLDNLVDWELMTATYWNNTAEHPDRMERRMAECLVYGSLPWEAVEEVVVRSEDIAAAARAVLVEFGQVTPVTVTRHWYFS